MDLCPEYASQHIDFIITQQDYFFLLLDWGGTLRMHDMSNGLLGIKGF
jgi:hypothetical protein